MSSTIRITLPDGSVREVPSGTTSRQIAESIGAGLARAALAARVDGAVRDLGRPLEADASLAILTERDPDALEVLRHSSAHILATAVRELFPGAGIGFGPPIEDGFYYDFDVPRPFTPEDLELIESRMTEVARADYPFVREVVDRSQANHRFADDPLKLERIAELGDAETITVYTDGPFTDLCRGPHIPRTGRLKHFKLLHAAGAYWRGDEKRQMLQRIYGTAWFKKEDLDAYLHRLEEARKRDHRVLGRQLDLFSTSDVLGPGLVLWHPRGAVIRWLLSRAVEDDNVASGYDLVYTPNVTREELFYISGHLPLYASNQYPAMGAGAGEAEDVRYMVKPMNCPMHALIYQSRQRSYRDLPIRLSEVANVYRNEKSGTLHGLLRVRGLCMDDAHIFCTMDQIEDEIFLCLDQVDRLVRATFGFELDFEVSTRPEERLGSDEVWDQAEATLRRALERKGIAFRNDVGGGAFYGPKIDIKFRDAIGRIWQGPTIQLDFNLPERFELEYTGTDNRPHRPVMIHRAIYGTLERFTGNLIEHFAGAFPVWLAPEQVRVIPISDAQAEAARGLAQRLKAAGLRVRVDDSSETLNYRIREGEVQKVPYMAIVGQREADSGSLALRVRGTGKKQEAMSVDAFLGRITEEVRTRALAP
ncbi:MAG: threonine--tRNA ligase [Gemmatimonadales bacterium]|nr:threonine--tRNA ligase [Gemmatimonadales bacterium]MDQ3427431.1 threonine--tRNA ligase [Gemmatimonadota bacterium]